MSAVHVGLDARRPRRTRIQNFGSSAASVIAWPSFGAYVLYGAMPPVSGSSPRARRLRRRARRRRRRRERHAVGHRDVEDRALAGARALRERAEDPITPHMPPLTSASWKPGTCGGPSVGPLSAEHAGAREVVEVVPRALRERAGLAVAGERADDEPRVAPRAARVAEAEAIEHAGAELLEEHVVAADEAQERVARPRASSGRGRRCACRG